MNAEFEADLKVLESKGVDPELIAELRQENASGLVRDLATAHPGYFAALKRQAETLIQKAKET